jgi:hypothetical protein
MKELKIFEKKDFYKIKDMQKEKPNAVMGIVYAIGYNNGFCKIGMSSLPADRTSALSHYISDYMQMPVDKIVISGWHTNYRQNERILHEEFSSCRIPNTELFSCDIQEVIDFMNDDGIKFEDNSNEILKNIERRSDKLIEFAKSVMCGGFEYENAKKFCEEYDKILKESNELTDEIIFMAKVLVDNYKDALEERTKKEVSELKACFVDKWIQYGLIDEEKFK